MQTIARRGSSALLLVLLVGCSVEASEDDSVVVAESEEAIISEKTVALTASELALATIQDDALVFAEPTEKIRNIGVGNIVIGALDDETAVMRRVEHISERSDGALVFATTDAPLVDAAPTVRTQKSISLPDISFDKSGTVLGEVGGIKVSCSKCFIKYEPKFDFGFRIEGGQLSEFIGKFDGELEGKLELKAETEDLGGSIEKEFELIRVRKTFVQTIGIVPVWEDVELSVVAGVNASVEAKTEMTTGLSANARTTLELVRQDGEWQFDGHKSGKLTFEQPVVKTSLGVGAGVSLTVRAEVTIYSILEAYLQGKATADVKATLCPSPANWQANGAFAVSAGGGIKIPYLFERTIDHELWKVEAEKSGDLPFLQGISCQ